MPELPEVEAIRMQLEKFLTGHAIEKVEIKNPRTFTGDPKAIEGALFKNFHRFGKVLSMELDNNFSIVVHVKMTGQLIYRGPNLKNPNKLSEKVTGGVPGPHTMVIITLDKGGMLYYNDFRRFGYVKVVETAKLKEGNDLLGKMGPEPLKDLTLELFSQILSKTKRAVKVVLMDQSKIGGIGNIYANDALWLSKIHPKQPASTIPSEKVEELYNAIEDVLKKGMEFGGSSENSFVKPDGTEGEYQSHTLVYGKQKTKCSRCGTIIEKFMLGGRGTYVCPSCQQLR